MKSSLFVLFFFLASCANLKKTVIASALTGAIVGAAGGATFSPDEESVDKNTYLFGIGGALAGAGLSYLLYKEEKPELPKQMILEDPQTHKQVPLFDFSPELKNVKPEVKFTPLKKYEVPLEKLPNELKGKVKKQYIIEYEAEARTLNIGKRTIEISPFKAWEHVYEE